MQRSPLPLIEVNASKMTMSLLSNGHFILSSVFANVLSVCLGELSPGSNHVPLPPQLISITVIAVTR